MGENRTVGRALLVGYRGEGPVGVETDMQAMTAMLERRGFVVDAIAGPGATRAAILAAYDELIDRIQPDQAAVFYYTGHGWYSVPDHESGVPWQGICPADLAASTTEDFRGITSWELSIKQAQLTSRTRNVTVILDCCHAAQMSRDAASYDAVCRVLPHPYRLGFAAHARALRSRYGAAVDAVRATSNPDAVRLVACGQDESAFGYPVNGVYRGAFTEAVLEVLGEVGDAAVSWAALGGVIRERVHRKFRVQRSEIEGPTRRRPFSLEEVDVATPAAITNWLDALRIEAGSLLGVTTGDVFGAMPAGSVAYHSAAALAELEVTDTSPTFASARARRWSNGCGELPAGAVAFPIVKQLVRRAVRVDVSDAAHGTIVAEIDRSGTLRLAEPGEFDALATLRLRGDALTIEDTLGPLRSLRPFPGGLPQAVATLVDLGAAQALREFAGEHGVLAGELDIEWGAIVHGKMRRMPESGGTLALRDLVYIAVRSKAQRPLYVHVFNIGIQGKITLLTRTSAPSGYLLTPQAPELVLGRHFDGSLPGLPLSWADDLPRTLPRIDQVAVIVTAAPTSLQGLESQERRGVRRGAGNRLQDLLAQLQDGQPRDLRGAASDDGFYMKCLSYLLQPRDAMIADISFEVDHSLWQAAARAGEAWATSSDDELTGVLRNVEVAIEIANLVAADHASSEVRLDALICTRSSVGAAGYSTWTQSCHIRKDVANPDATLVAYRGPVRDFVEICLWMSPDVAGKSALTSLLGQRGDRDTIADATRALVADGVSPAEPWIVATGAVAALARTAYEALCDGTGEPFGLYRAAFLARDQFGTGRGAGTCTQRTRDYAFAVRIVPVADLARPEDPASCRNATA